jgi:uncharacterized SAM-binding protein YcdF (DUF218 family)
MLSERELFISIVGNDWIQKSDAIVLLEGDGLNRYREAVRLYKAGWGDKIVFSGGITDYDYGSYPFSDILPLMIKERVPKSAIIHESKSLNTHEQAVEIVKLAITHQWKRIILVASCEHQYRAYLTFLKEVLKNYPELIIYNSAATNFKWFAQTAWGIRFERLNQEFEKIDRYSRSGHIATYKEAIDYQEWKEQQ